jgi:hypothetical protein
VNRKIDGIKTKCSLNYYQFNEYLPNLLQKGWSIRNNGVMNDREIRSKYLELIFISKPDGRAYCYYRQSTEFLLNGKWYLTS